MDGEKEKKPTIVLFPNGIIHPSTKVIVARYILMIFQAIILASGNLDDVRCITLAVRKKEKIVVGVMIVSLEGFCGNHSRAGSGTIAPASEASDKKQVASNLMMTGYVR
jgi:hypothetical protein